MEKKSKKRKAKLFFREKKNVDQGVLEGFFNSLFLTNKTEKKKTLTLLEKSNVQALLFYTDYRNLPNILKNGIVPLKNLKLSENEIYHVWSFLQHEESIDLEFDISSRAYFWKWINDIDFDPQNVAVIGINPKRLTELTQKDWLLDWAQSMVNVSETIYVENFDWILIQDLPVYNKIQKAIAEEKLTIDLYYGHQGIVKTQGKNRDKEPKLDQQLNKGETING